MTGKDLLLRMNPDSFHPFRLHLADGGRIDVVRPDMAIVGLTTAVLPTAFKSIERGYQIAQIAAHWRTVTLADVVRVDDAIAD